MPRVEFWNHHLLADNSILPSIGPLSIGIIIGILVALLSVVFSIKVLWRTPVYLAFYVTASGAIALFHGLIYGGSTRHYGHFFIIFVASLWLASRSEQSAEVPTKATIGNQPQLHKTLPGSAFLTAVLIFQAAAGIHAYTVDLLHPFSASKAVASYIQTHQLEAASLFSQDDRNATGVAAYLNRQLYYPQRQALGSFWDISRPDLETPEAVMESLLAFSQQSADETSPQAPYFLAILLDYIDPVAIQNALQGEVTLLMETSPTIQPDERLYLYCVKATLE